MQVAGQRLSVPGLELEPELPLAKQLFVGGEPRGDRQNACRQPPYERAWHRPQPFRGQHEHVGLRERLDLGHLVGVDELDAVAERAAERGG